MGELSGVSLEDGLGVALGDGEGVGDFFFFRFFFGEIDGDAELFTLGVAEASGVEVADDVASGDGVGVPFFLAEGEGETFGDALGEGLFFAAAFFFFGGGVGSKRRFILVPKSCARADSDVIVPNAIA